MAGIARGILIRLGVDRTWAARYRDPDLPSYLRNGPLALIPLCLAFLLCMIPVYAIDMDGPRADLGGGLAIGGLLLILASVVLMERPPRWIKPAWLRDEEELERLGYHSAYFEELDERGRYTPRWQLRLAWAVVAVVPLGVIFLDWPPGALAGLATVVPLLRAAKVREGRGTPFTIRRRR